MSDERQLSPCDTCGARVPELRRGRCWGCYLRWVEARPVGQGAACVVCDERRRDNLRLVELYHRWTAMCHSCSSRSARLEPMPTTVEAIRVKLERDRRSRERRYGKADTRIFPRDRRRDDRREERGGDEDRPTPAERAAAGFPELDGIFEGASFADLRDTSDGEQTVIRDTSGMASRAAADVARPPANDIELPTHGPTRAPSVIVTDDPDGVLELSDSDVELV